MVVYAILLALYFVCSVSSVILKVNDEYGEKAILLSQATLILSVPLIVMSYALELSGEFRNLCDVYGKHLILLLITAVNLGLNYIDWKRPAETETDEG